MLKIFYLFLIPFGLEISVVENAQVQWGYINRGYYMATRTYEISLLFGFKYFTSERSERVKYFFQLEKRNFVSSSDHVIFYLLYKHQ